MRAEVTVKITDPSERQRTVCAVTYTAELPELARGERLLEFWDALDDLVMTAERTVLNQFGVNSRQVSELAKVREAEIAELRAQIKEQGLQLADGKDLRDPRIRQSIRLQLAVE